MKFNVKTIIAKYFDSYWIPLTLLALYILFIGMSISFFIRLFHMSHSQIAVFGFIEAVLCSFLLIGILLASIWNFVKKRWVKGTVNLFLFMLIFFVAALFLFLRPGPSEDNFTKNIIIPPELHMEDPLPTQPEEANIALDSEGKTLVEIFAQQNKWPPKTTINTDIDILDTFQGRERAMLLRHLASSSKWYLSREEGKLYAYRRFVSLDGRWKNTLHGYYTTYDVNSWDDKHYQFRIIIGVDGPVWDSPWQGKLTKTRTGSGEIKLNIEKSVNPGYNSYFVLESAGPAIEIFEEAETQQRPFTPLALSLIEKELKALSESAEARDKGFDINLMPQESVKIGEPEIYIVGSGGIYLVYAYANPKEPGYAYIKAFEETKNIPLSSNTLAKNSVEYIGWSKNTNEQFFYNSQIMIYEGDWGKYYPARLELWFVPDSGNPERKLIDKIFKIEGWQR